MIKYNLHIKILLVFVSLLTIFIFRESRLDFDQKCNDLFHQLNGQKQTDTNIVIIHIDRADVENLGPWPLKRSYYALLINNLKKFQVKTIGFEIFLSDKFTNQTIYNDLLNNEIRKSGNVVLSSIIENFGISSETGILVLPQPKISVKDLKTGHLNYIDDHGIFIPLVFHSGSVREDAFSYAIAEKSHRRISPDSLIKVNFFSSWRKFNNFSLIEFFNMVEAQDSRLLKLKDKIVLIGLSDPQIAQIVPTAFDNQLPGIGLQAFALDNILNGRYIITKFTFILSIISIIILLAFVTVKINVRFWYKYLVLFAAFLLISFLSFNYLFIQQDYSVFLIPLFVLLIYDFSLFFVERNRQLSGIRSETETLKASLEEKEKQLLRLQNELDASSIDSSNRLTDKISILKEEIARLRFEQTDSISSEIEEKKEGVENFHGIIYKSREMHSVISLIKKVSPSDATVLILGESGTGKELVARAVHRLNLRRKDNSFVAVNCAALSDTLLESELFGHVKGAFTNAIADKLGRFEAANNGTIFLDEIGETSENFQLKLLRILQTGEFEKVGSSKTIKTDVRVIAATNKNLEELVRQKKFREDLYYRLNVIKIELPPLRERKEDIEPITSYFLNCGEQKFSLSKAALDQLNKFGWKGNVRELESVIKRAMIFAKSSERNIIKLSDLPEEILSKDKSNLEAMILEALREKKFSHSSINETAKDLGDISRTIVSENFRGIAFRTYYSLNYNMDKTVEEISATGETQVLEKVRTKVKTFLCNIEDDVLKLKPAEFEAVRAKLNSKYKNLPQKYHFYLDEIIKNILK